MKFSRRAILHGAVAGLLRPGRRASPEPTAGVPGSTLEIGRRFRDHGITGTFVLLAVEDDTLLVHNPARAEQEFSPASTFKIPNSLIALETGAIADENVVLKWDGARTGPSSSWKDQSLRTAFAASAVWFYQEMARRIGEKRMAEWIDRLGYGNRKIGGGIDQFWLTGALRITARQEVEFLRRLYKDQLPFSERSRRMVKDILVLEKTGAYVLRGKTGWARGEPGNDTGLPGLGWFTGWIERGDRGWVFASNIDMVREEHAALRKELPIEVLRGLGLLEGA